MSVSNNRWYWIGFIPKSGIWQPVNVFVSDGAARSWFRRRMRLRLPARVESIRGVVTMADHYEPPELAATKGE